MKLATLKDGGRAVSLEFVPEPNRVTPPQSAGFALTSRCSISRADRFAMASISA